MYLIYKYTNSVNGKVYIGQTSKTLEERAQANGRNYRECRRFYNAIQKYSWDAFTPEVLESVETAEDANAREQYYIALYRSTDPEYGYNLDSGGLNHTVSEETRTLISDMAKERYKDRTANPMYGKKHSEKSLMLQRECKLGEKNPMFGTTWNTTQRERSGIHKGQHMNFSESQLAYYREHARWMGSTIIPKPVRCIEDNATFPTVTAAAEAYGVNAATLSGHLHGRQKTCRSKHFEYVS